MSEVAGTLARRTASSYSGLVGFALLLNAGVACAQGNQAPAEPAEELLRLQNAGLGEFDDLRERLQGISGLPRRQLNLIDRLAEATDWDQLSVYVADLRTTDFYRTIDPLLEGIADKVSWERVGEAMGVETWKADLAPSSFAVVSRDREGQVDGIIVRGETTRRIVGRADRFATIDRPRRAALADHSPFGDDQEHDTRVGIGDCPEDPIRSCPAADGPAEIGLFFLYTPAASTRLKDQQNSFLTRQIVQLNLWMKHSGVEARVLHRGYQVVSNYTETGNYETEIERMVRQDRPGPFADLDQLRQVKHADVVVLIVDKKDGCGRAGSIGPRRERAFAVVHWDCFDAPNFSLAHEFAHLLGARHDRDNDPCDRPHADAHGYRREPGVGQDNFRTIMAYPCGGVSCGRVNFFANPDELFGNHRLGEPDGSTNNVRVMNSYAPCVASFFP